VSVALLKRGDSCSRWQRACGAGRAAALPPLAWRGGHDLTRVMMVKRVGSWSCVAGGAAAQLGSESAARRLAAAFAPRARGKMPSTIAKPFYCSCLWSRVNAGVGSGLAPYSADLG